MQHAGTGNKLAVKCRQVQRMKRQRIDNEAAQESAANSLSQIQIVGKGHQRRDMRAELEKMAEAVCKI